MAVSFPLPERGEVRGEAKYQASEKSTVASEDQFSKVLDDARQEIRQIVRNVFDEYEKKLKR